MKYYFLFLLLLFYINPLYAVDSDIALDKAPINIYDIQSIKRGAKIFATTCMACHTMIYLRYNKIAQASGVRYDKMPLHITQWPNGIKPPDLSLEADIHGPDWIYTYLHSFYLDPARPTGFNNLLVPNTAMMNMLVPFQGQQIIASDLNIMQKYSDAPLQWYDVLELQRKGSLTPKQFDDMVTDIVNFLTYAANPYQAFQWKLGYYVLGFLVILFILMYLLKRNYWQDIKKE